MTDKQVKTDPYYRAGIAIRKEREPELRAILERLGLKTVGELVQLIMMPGAAEDLMPAARRRLEAIEREQKLAPEREEALRKLQELSTDQLLELAKKAA